MIRTDPVNGLVVSEAYVLDSARFDDSTNGRRGNNGTLDFLREYLLKGPVGGLASDLEPFGPRGRRGSSGLRKKEKDTETEPETEDSSTMTLAQAALYKAAQTVLENGMRLLGLVPITTRDQDREDQDRVDSPTAE